ncbi:hypothetical protein NBRC10512_005759 [Rhodotorula toruloides]|uniref:Inositol-1-monophosphatase n=2 Tax=Rhodotorula toruloides TaxID=5286 RepID=A0A061BFX0_RHOTO|nr:myo-inositol-1(or 4)-monophosphatase [Rhodotorula toruloides NP11]EMS18710.1 myo-inositol-1(or 4)-monophosphatase [Rhodotorula toruloides NP11]CDR48887.1 RHTO0S21e01002g1_1 [Rhodotorula toruloides]
MATDSIDLQEIYQFAIQLAKDAGRLILEGSSKRTQSAATTQDPDTKKNRVDLVTETDQAVEAFIKRSIADKYPSFKFIGEESFAGGERVDLTDEPTFIVDPIDGTTNFVHAIDFVCCSIGFTYKQEPVIGVIYNPFLDKLYSALQGHGAYLNQTTRLPLTHPNPPPLPSLGDAVIGVEWGSDRSKAVIEKKGRTYMKLAGDGKEVEGGVMAHSLRSIGSAALNYSMVAAGQLDLYWEIGCWSWDVCAGTIIAREAGGKVYGKGGKPWQPQDLMGHHFLVVRAIADTPGGETGEQAQDRIAKEFFQVAEEWDV